jgi:hypothetical protein
MSAVWQCNVLLGVARWLTVPQPSTRADIDNGNTKCSLNLIKKKCFSVKFIDFIFA